MVDRHLNPQGPSARTDRQASKQVASQPASQPARMLGDEDESASVAHLGPRAERELIAQNTYIEVGRYVCMHTNSRWSREIYASHTAGALLSVSDSARPFACIPSLFTMPDDAIAPSTSLPETIRRTFAAAPPSLTAPSCITPASSASSSLATRAQPDHDHNHIPEPHHSSSRPSHLNLDHISRSLGSRIYFPSIAYV